MKTYKMKVGQADIDRAERVTFEFNNKLNSLRESGSLSKKEFNALPEDRTVENVLNSVRTRRHFDALINNMERFIDSQPEFVTNKTGNVESRFQINENKILLDSVNSNKEYMRAIVSPSTETGTMGRESNWRLEDKKEVKFEDTYFNDYSAYTKSLMNQARRDYNESYQSKYKENYLLSFDKNFNSRSKVDSFREKILLLTPEQIEKWYYGEGDVASPEFHYELLAQDNRIDAMNASLERFILSNPNLFTKKQKEQLLNEV